MGPKTAESKGTRTKSHDGEKEEVLQAVVLGDVFESEFAPFTLEKPRCLLPLVNVPLIEYTLEFLAQSGVQEVFFSAGSHTSQVEQYFDSSRWRRRSSPFKKFHFLKSAAMSVGDVMRDLDQKGLITGDFLAVSGDVVSNFPIAEAMAKHKARRLKDRNAIMTMLLRDVGQSRGSLVGATVQTFVIDPTKDRCLHYEEHRKTERTSVAIDPDILSASEIELRQDLFDCRIDICTPDMLSLWSDNFDNQSPRKDFLHGVLKDHELNGKTIHTYIVDDHFAGRVRDLRTYDATSRDILSRWSYPLCPDAGADYRMTRRGVYEGEGVKIAKSSRVRPNCVIGSGTVISDKSLIQNSVIGKNCQIGPNVKICDAFIWDNVVIEDGATISLAIIADKALIGKGCTVTDGSLVSFGVHLREGTHLRHGSSDTQAKTDRSGEAVGFEDSDEEAARHSAGLVYRTKDFATSISSFFTDESGDFQTSPVAGGSRSHSFATNGSIEDEDGDRFHQEAAPSLFERMKSGTDQDDVRVELMSLRFAQNASERQIRRAVAVAMTKTIASKAEDQTDKVPGAVQTTISLYARLIPSTGKADFLLEAQRDLARRVNGATILLHLAKELYDRDVLEEADVTSWWNDERSESTEELKLVKAPSRPFLDWLANAEEESDTESEEG